jgi:hypothetical protein
MALVNFRSDIMDVYKRYYNNFDPSLEKNTNFLVPFDDYVQQNLSFDNVEKKSVNSTGKIVHKFKKYGVLEFVPYNGQRTLRITNQTKHHHYNMPSNYIINMNLWGNYDCVGIFGENYFKNLPNNSFDKIIFEVKVSETDIFEYEIKRLLRPGGTVIFRSEEQCSGSNILVKKFDGQLYIIPKDMKKNHILSDITTLYKLNKFNIFNWNEKDEMATFQNKCSLFL